MLGRTNASAAMIRCLCIKLLFDGKYIGHGELCDVSIRCDVCRECDEGVGIASPKKAVGRSGVGGVNQYMIAGHIC